MKNYLSILLGLIFIFSVNTSNATEVTSYKNADFRMELPKDFNFVQTAHPQNSKSNRMYLFSPKNAQDDESGIIVYVEPNFPTPHGKVKAERDAIAMLNADLREASGHPMSQKDIELIHKNSKEAIANNKKFQTYQIRSPNTTITYFSLLSHGKMYIIQIHNMYSKPLALNTDVLVEMLSSFTPR